MEVRASRRAKGCARLVVLGVMLGLVPQAHADVAPPQLKGADRQIVVDSALLASRDLDETMFAMRESGGDAKANMEDASVTVPLSGARPITVERGHTPVRLKLPFQATRAPAELDPSGMVVNDNRNLTHTVTAVRDDGSLQVHFVIEAPEAPSEFPFSVSLPANAKAYRVGQSIVFMNGNEVVAGLAPAWAKDAKGRSVPTRYVLKGDGDVVQVVEHGSQYAYPVVADPWLGFWLFEGFSSSRKSYGGQKAYSARLTPYGWGIYTGIAGGGGLLSTALGYKIIREAGWSEWKQKLVGSHPAKTLEQQYVCHARFGYAFWKAGFHWDLEAARPSKPDWTSDPWSHKCNWKK